MSTFSGFNTGLSGLLSHQRALEVASNNIANLNTVGYTRQRAELQSMDPQSRAGVQAGSSIYNGGVRVGTVQRLGDVHLEAQVRSQTANAGKMEGVAEAWKAAEATLREPSEKGLGESLARFYNAWSDVGNLTQSDAAKSVLFEDAKALVNDIRHAQSQVSTAWQDMRAKMDGLANEVNAAAAGVADLNDRILSSQIQGTPTGHLEDERAKLLTELSDLVGATAQTKDNGSYDVYVGGYNLVSGSTSFTVSVEGAVAHDSLMKWKPEDGLAKDTGPVRLMWDRMPVEAKLDGGKIAGYIEGLDLADKGGALPTMAAKYDELAKSVADSVNSVLEANGHDPMFTFGDADAPARTIQVAYTSGAQIKTNAQGAGEFDNSLADQIERAGLGRGGVSDQWGATVADIGVQTRSAERREINAVETRDNSVNKLQAETGVNLDEEVMTLMAAQTAYAGAARVISTLDSMFNSLLAMGAR